MHANGLSGSVFAVDRHGAPLSSSLAPARTDWRRHHKWPGLHPRCSAGGRPPAQRAAANPLPEGKSVTEAARTPTSVPAQSTSSARSVLIVDDAPESRELLSWQLGNDTQLQLVGQAARGSEAVELAGELQPDLVILDLNMPGQDGLDTIPHLFASAPHTTVVVLTSYNSPSAMRSAYMLGAAQCLLKGIRKDELLHTLHEVLGLA